jgi:transposase
MQLYGGIDLHSNNSVLGIMDETTKRILKKRIANDAGTILATLEPYQNNLVGIVVESTYNWCWLVDALMEHGYRVHLSNPCANQQYSGLKYRDDNHDAFWLADLLRLGSLKEGYIYPKQDRPLRDLSRKRLHLVKLRTSLILSLKGLIVRTRGIGIKADRIKEDDLDTLLRPMPAEENFRLLVKSNKDSIDFLGTQIDQLETSLLAQLKGKPLFKNLLTLPGIGKVLAWTIQLETGPISRFGKVGPYSSYCRKVQSRWTSNDKTKGKGNAKNGNKYLAWAYAEAAEQARRFYPGCRTFYNRKLSQTNAAIAHHALAHKLTRAAYYVLRDNVPYDEAKLFG